ncbi:hypothetical protein BKA70DRAFT_111628 [Coprinopsis sp. MPI-PUGE-AT-0042]|nr:hypothetical protein BKA70DRAFT_111628 [Coprinopsis sp. MPI-PUGE-AT-0042]
MARPLHYHASSPSSTNSILSIPSFRQLRLRLPFGMFPAAELPMWKNIIRNLTKAGKVSWSDFQAEVVEYYPCADEEYTLSDLHNLVNQTAQKRMDTKPKFVEYLKNFNLIADTLEENGQGLDARQRDRVFFQGIPPNVCKHLKDQLRVKKPDHKPGVPYKMADIKDAATYAIAQAIEDETVVYLPPSLSQPPASIPPPSSLPPVPQVTRKVFDGTSPTNLDAKVNGLVDKLDQVLSRMIDGNAPKATDSRANPSQGDSSKPRPNAGMCSFCSETTHFIRSCPQLDTYLQRGLCRRNSEGKITFPTIRLSPTKPVPDAT